ncbi:Gldg family protein [Roseospirillum parvum]|uniref:ABC-type uncharacterized transport system involved in gliding motility, auxiliary component n=1 Tax=Roseospirillum parvum TaxID=83401 RepID=A0A1G8BAE5_9PROT|nr:Gldg family protein [Roseospirillum parvum]SDH29560.1 ABC-type uncharacterized transport system involved in gliding motility, auxiliary component [Roseospirillum parvum]
MMRFLETRRSSTLAIAGLVLGALIFLLVNVLAQAGVKQARLDLTEGGLYTVSDSTRRVLKDLPAPITATLYFSSNLGEAVPRYREYFERVRDLLARYRDLSRGRLTLKVVEPEPFSPAEDRAVAAGLQGVPITQAGDPGYFGLVATDSTDGREVIPFFNLDREAFLEYDLTRLFLSLADPERPVVGLLAGLPLTGSGSPPMAMGGQPPGGQPWLIVEQIRQFFDLKSLPDDATPIPGDVDVLMVVAPSRLSEAALYAIDQYALSGGPVLMFADPVAETAALERRPPGADTGSDVAPLLAAWGIDWDAGKVALDAEAARRVAARGTLGRQQVIDYLAWLSLTPRNLLPGEPMVGDLEALNLATAGVLTPIEGSGVEVTPLITTSPRSDTADSGLFEGRPDPMDLLAGFTPRGQSLLLAARLRGDIATAYPDGPPEGVEAGAATPLAKSVAPLNAVVVADADMLYEQFWATRADFFGQAMTVPQADNHNLVINALESLSGGEALADLRGRGTTERPFTLIQDIRRQAELTFRAKEEQLSQRLDELTQRLQEIQSAGGQAGQALLSEAERQEVDRFRAEMLEVRQELRAVQHAMRQEIETVKATVRWLNIAGLPVLLTGVAIGAVILRRRRRAAAQPPVSAGQES